MKWTGLNELREKYLSFFESKGHLRLDSFPLVPKNDPSLLLINSGMAPMKKWFLAQEEPPRHRVTTCQKCIRTPDIERVGITARHGTFFEMLGNFSFQDYFKPEAIAWAWEFLTKVVEIPPEKLYISVYTDDDEAYDIWTKEVGIPEDHMVRFGKEDNFWEHGSGPCGPCSEIYFDRGPEFGCGKPDCKVGCDCDRYMEVWNLVFSQYDSDGKGHYERLARPNIDTGMGLERLACVMQGVGNLFEVDTVQAILHHVEKITGKTYGADHKTDVSIRVITDHIRSTTFMVSDGILPSNEGRGYVLRRLLRRAARHGKLLGVDKPFLYEVVETVIQENESHYTYLRERADYITRWVRLEEETFAKTIDGGMRIFEEMLAEHKAANEKVFSGADAFKLYDTYGFPIDLTIEMAEEAGMTVDQDAFAELMKQQKERAREARKALGDLAWAGIDFGLDNTPTEFTGYTRHVDEGKVLAICVGEEVTGAIAGGETGILVLDRTPFYAEMGGQTADHGTISIGESVFEVSDVQKDKGGKYLHHGKMISGEIKVDDTVTAAIDETRRQAICRAHSATHLLQAALEKVLGDHCHQAGSLVEPDRLRFDFTHFSAMTPEELQKVNECVVEMVLDGMDVETMELPIEEAKKLGATALFGEKYGDIVRVVKMGDKSLEFCGGTHLENTAKVGLFTITSECSVASGVRRLEAITGKAVLNHMRDVEQTVAKTAEILKVPNPKDILNKAESTVGELKDLRQKIEALKERALSGDVKNFMLAAKDVKGISVITTVRNDLTVPDLRKFGDMLRDRSENVVAVLVSTNGDKISILAVCGKEAVARGIKAGALVKHVCGICGGSGGGKPDSAMGGGKDALKIDDALASVDDFVAENVK